MPIWEGLAIGYYLIQGTTILKFAAIGQGTKYNKFIKAIVWDGMK